MKFHRILVEQIVLSLEAVFQQKLYCDKVIEKAFKKNRKWGSRDRRYFAESLYDMVRWYRLLAELAQSENPWHIWAVYTLRQGFTLPPWDEISAIHPADIKNRQQQIKQKAVKESYPDWLYQLGKKQLKENWASVASALNQQAEVYFRCNTLKTSREELLHQLQHESIECMPIEDVALPDAIQLTRRQNVFHSKSFKAGYFEVQDASSQQIAPLLDVQPGQQVVDACAGAGGKSLHIAALMNNKGRVLAMDLHQWKLNNLRKRAKRNGIDIVETRVIENNKTIKRLADKFDRVLLDVPCSGTGVLRRNPDAKWKLSLEEIERLQELQQHILQSYCRMCKPGGRMVYATCSVLPSENQQQVEQFLANHPDWKLVQEITLLPGRDPYDGFYAAALERS